MEFVQTAVFETRTFHADAATGGDANDGLSWEKPTKTIQAAVDAAIDGERVLVAAGTYEPFRTDGKRIRIEGVDDAERIVVDGGGTNRCATLRDDTNSGYGHGPKDETTVVGLTFRNGRANYGGGTLGGTLNGCELSGNYADSGGGSYGGTLIDCDVLDNRAKRAGGGVSWATAVRCRIVGNEVRPEEPATGEWWWLSGGGSDESTLVDCLVAGNAVVTVDSADRAVGGGTFAGPLYNCTVADNWIEGPGQWRGDGVCNGHLYGCIVAGNGMVRVNRECYVGDSVYGPDDYLKTFSTFVGDDPGFVDSAGGDYRLREDSPCVDAGELGKNAEWNELDLDGHPRVRGAAVDQGCYESSYEKTQTSTTPVPVPFDWLDSHYADLAVRGGYEDRANATAANGVDEIWKCFVTGVVPTDGDDRFLATIEMKDGEPDIGWTPDLNEGGTKSERVYTVEGMANLGDESWGPTNAASRFFRVKVSMP